MFTFPKSLERHQISSAACQRAHFHIVHQIRLDQIELQKSQIQSSWAGYQLRISLYHQLVLAFAYMIVSFMEKHRHRTDNLQVELQFMCKQEPRGKCNPPQGKKFSSENISFFFYFSRILFSCCLYFDSFFGCVLQSMLQKLAVGAMYISTFSLL